jgi:superfamily II DNA or RNA helicase
MVTRPTLRPYQDAAIERLRQKIREGKRRLVLVMPTGGGKTVVAAAMIHSALARNSRSLFFAHRRELVDQTMEKLGSFGVEAGVIMAGDKRRDDYLPTQVASVQTLVRRLDRKPPADIVYVDECHHATSETYQRVLDAYPGAIIIGLTATPWRADRIGLGDIYDDFVLACTPAELMRIGALVYYDAFAYDAPELHDVRTTAGDFNQQDLGVACNTKVLVASVVTEYMRHAKGRRAIVFPVNVEHNTPTEQRKTTMQRFKTGDLTILSSVGVLTEGFDAPAAEVCILARPTKSLTLFIQMVGRVLRPCPETGKQRALIHDHAGNTIRHGFIEEDRDYSLLATPNTVRSLHTCPACHKIFSSLKEGHCPHCGELIGIIEDRSEPGERKKHIYVDGERITREQIEKIRGKRAMAQLLLELTDEDLARAALASRQEKAAEYLRLQIVQQRKGLQDGFVAHQFRAVFSHWPKFTDDELAAAQPATKPFFPLRGRRSA